MDMRRTSSFLTSQSMGTKDICILVVHDDPMHRNIIFEMLENCSHYEVMKFQKMGDALNTVGEKKDRLEIVITDVQQSNSNGLEILNRIKREFKLRAISMDPRENAKVVSVGLNSSAKLYFVKSLSENEFATLWQQAYTKERGKATSFQKALTIHEKEDTGLERESPIHDVRQSDKRHKRKAIEDTDEQSEEDNDEFPKEKKPRIMWNEQLHYKFLRAVELLGHDRAYPKKIVELMNVPGLTRENVASHLQKFRLNLKRAQEQMQSASSVFGINSPPPGGFKSSHSDFNSSEQNNLQYHTQSPIYTPYLPKLNPVNIPISTFNFPYPETSTSTLNFGHQKSIIGNNQESLKSTFGINNCLISETEKNTSSINNYYLISNTENNTSSINIPMPLSNFSYPHHSEISTTTSNFVHQESPLSPYTHNSSLLVHENPQPDSSNNTSYVGFKLTGNGISFECGKNSSQINNNVATDNHISLDEGRGNESLAQYPLTESDNNVEQQFYSPLAESDIENLLNEIGVGATSPPIIFD